MRGESLQAAAGRSDGVRGCPEDLWCIRRSNARVGGMGVGDTVEWMYPSLKRKRREPSFAYASGSDAYIRTAMNDYTSLDEDRVAKKRSRISMSFDTPIAPASMLKSASRRCI